MEALSGYFRSLERCLDCPKAVRQPFLAKTRQLAEDFIQGKPDTTPEEITDYLGSPQELAQGFLETLEPEVLEQHRRRKKLFSFISIIVLITALAIAVIWIIHLRNSPLTVEISETTIIYREFTEET